MGHLTEVVVAGLVTREPRSFRPVLVAEMALLVPSGTISATATIKRRPKIAAIKTAVDPSGGGATKSVTSAKPTIDHNALDFNQ